MQPNDDDLFLESPFSNVAGQSSAKCWAGRPKVHDSLLRVKRALSRMTDSTLDLMWASLGAGKTHTLLHLASLLEDRSFSNSGTIAVFVEMPEQVRNFVDVYKRIISASPLDRLAEIIGNCPTSKLLDSVARAANVIRHGNVAQRQLVTEWLAADRPLLKDLRQLTGITQRIEEDIAATDVLCCIAQACALNRVRLLILVDEFQRIGVLKPTAQRKVLSCLRSVYSRTPSYFSMVLSIQSLLEENALKFIPPELATLLGKKPTISLPEMDQPEAKEFLIGRFEFFRRGHYAGPATAPFDSEAVDAVLHCIHDDAGMALNPREILQAFALVYSQAEHPNERITASEAVEILRATYVTRREA